MQLAANEPFAPSEPIKVAFLLDSFIIAGGVSVIIEHCRGLKAPHFQSFIVTKDAAGRDGSWHPAGNSLRVISLEEAKHINFDIAIATWWKTCYELHQLRARHYAYFVQSIESRFYQSTTEDFVKPLVTATYHLPVTFLTEARWIRDYIRRMRPGASVFYVRNGIDKRIFNLGEVVELEANSSRPLRILIEGPLGVWFKQTTDAIEVVSDLPFPKRITLVSASDVPAGICQRVDSVFTKVPVVRMPEIYRNTDVLLKISKVEGMFMPPLEAFHCGATTICSWVTGCDEYLKHGWNALVAFPDDYDSIRRYLMIINKDRRLLNALRYNALATARVWPSWQQSSRFMAAVLTKVARQHVPSNSHAALLIPSLFQKSLDAILLRRGPEVANILKSRDAAFITPPEYATEIAELRKFREIILASGSYRFARKMSTLRQIWPIRKLRRIAPSELKRFLKHRLVR